MPSGCANTKTGEVERRRKIGLSAKRYWRNKEHRTRRLKALRKAAKDPERRRKISANHPRYWLGTKGARYGQKHTEETKQKISKTLTGRKFSKSWHRKQSASHIGKKRTRKSRQKQRMTMRRRYGTVGKRSRRRVDLRYKIWHDAVFDRDKKTCVLCGAHGRKVEIHADHIKAWALYPKLRYNVDNGRTLCYDCHLEHGWRGSWAK